MDGDRFQSSDSALSVIARAACVLCVGDEICVCLTHAIKPVSNLIGGPLVHCH